VLFEEIFFNEQNKSYRVLCISQPLGHVSGEYPTTMLHNSTTRDILVFKLILSRIVYNSQKT